MKITFKSVLIGLAAVLGIVGFCMMFLSPLKTVIEVPIVGTQVVEYGWKEVFFGIVEANGEVLEEKAPHATASMIGFFLMLVGAIAALAIAFLAKKPKVSLIVLVLGLIVAAAFAIGGILVFVTKTTYLGAFDVELPEEISKYLQLNTGAIVGGVLGLAAAALMVVGIVIPGPKAKKGKK